MPVFISYQHDQRLDAFILNERLLLEGIPTQLTRYDDATCQTFDDICVSLRQYLADSTHLICVLSQQAAENWWVAWQLGAAATSNRRISLYRSGPAPLPGYLERWPLLHEREHIDLFVRAYHEECTFHRAMAPAREGHHAHDRDNADFFHTDLKAKIRRGF
ncbi:toll/interleukin-1 receptor domain-containing protein [Pseudomonas xanthosomatis]|uniref:TIR domain-containing protein n=1 Tax=Pseudomonas xanthosomatis TaxID=2842356 RepID=UPI001C3C9A9B|nr:TIR domain-containing protein [Pseudomonas xanthosomatis]QXH47208.1 toll/interleukin-1 receptor domain-containing protein [Pseudomonas xanthosomatis]